MLIAVFSDVHSNLQAMQSVAKRVGDLKPDRCLCLGDLVGYGANPNECMEEARQLTDFIVVGNHDHAALNATDISSFNPYARKAAIWTREVLSEAHGRFLTGLPLTRTEERILCVHGSPCEPDEWHYVLSAREGENAFECMETDVCLIGHSHKPLVIERPEGKNCTLSPLNGIKLKKGSRYIINSGSVGQPRDGDPRASFLLLEGGKNWSARIERVEYDIGGAQRAILKAGLPPTLAERLHHGW